MKVCFDSLDEDKTFLMRELRNNVDDIFLLNEINVVIAKIEQCENYEEFVYILNNLLINPNHRSHQYVTKLIQDIANPISIPYIKKVLESDFTYLDYTCSESEVIAKWFSHALLSIGTEEAIDVIKKYSKSENNGIKIEMLYRLNKIT